MRLLRSIPTKTVLLGVAAAGLLAILAFLWLDGGRRDSCRSLSDAEAREMATTAFARSFGERPDSMLGGRNASQVGPGRVTRDNFGGASPLSSINAHFVDGATGREVIVARIFPDCDIEWRPSEG